MKRLFILAAVILSSLIITALVYSYLTSFRDVSINYMNVKDVSIINEESGDVVADEIENGSAVRLKKDVLYAVDYVGADGYSDGSQAITESTRNVTIDPDFSADRNRELAKELTPTINELLTKSHPLHKSYFTIENVTLRDKGTWMKATLVYKGDYDFNSDNLQVLLKNDNSIWELIGEPEIVFTTNKYADVPRDILIWANDSSS